MAAGVRRFLPMEVIPLRDLDGGGGRLARQEFGFDEGRTLSVVEDIARKSPVIIEMTISIGVKIACLVNIRPNPINSTCRDL